MKASNIYQKLKSAGIGNPDGVPSQKPIIKDVGIKSPLNMKGAPKSKKKDGESMTPYSVDKKTGKGVIHGPKVSYDMAYKNRGKQYKDMSKAEYIKEAKRQTKSFESSGNWDASGKKKSNDTGSKTNNSGSKTNNNANANNNKQNTNTNTDTNKKVDNKSKVDIAKEKVDTANKNIKDVKKSVKEDRKAKKLEDKAARKQKRADRIKEEGGTKVGNFLRGAKNKIKNIGKRKKKDDDDISVSAAKMKKSPMKMGKKSPTKFNAKLKKAAAEGKIKGKFKEVVENAPVKMKKSAMKMKKSAMKMGMKKSAAKMKYKK